MLLIWKQRQATNNWNNLSTLLPPTNSPSSLCHVVFVQHTFLRFPKQSFFFYGTRSPQLANFSSQNRNSETKQSNHRMIPHATTDNDLLVNRNAALAFACTACRDFHGFPRTNRGWLTGWLLVTGSALVSLRNRVQWLLWFWIIHGFPPTCINFVTNGYGSLIEHRYCSLRCYSAKQRTLILLHTNRTRQVST